MTTETILTEEVINSLSEKHLWGHAKFIGAGGVTIEGDDEFARAIEQAVLQSPEVQKWREDTARINSLEQQSKIPYRSYEATHSNDVGDIVMIHAKDAALIAAHNKAITKKRHTEETLKKVDVLVHRNIALGLSYVWLRWELTNEDVILALESLGYKIEFNKSHLGCLTTTKISF